MPSYGRLCAGLRLCPRPLPRSLLGVSLRQLASLEWFALEALGVDGRLAHQARSFLSSLRGGRCWFCGAPSRMLVEVWDLEARRGRGYAVLEAVRPSCQRCAAVVEAWGSRGMVVDRVARVNSIGREAAEELVNAVAEARRELESVSDWEFAVDIAGLEGAAEALNQLFRGLKRIGARLRSGWLVKGDAGPGGCPAPPDPGVLLDFLRGVGAEPSPALLLQPPPGGAELEPIWAARVASARAALALEALGEWRPTYTEASVAVSAPAAGLEVPIEVRMPCYDQLHFHEEALSLLRLVAAKVGHAVEATLVLRAGGEVYEVARARVAAPGHGGGRAA